jgi:hypothetical protein
MGTSTILDILGSIMIGGLLLLNINRLQLSANTHTAQFNMEAIVERNLVDVFAMMENDLLKIGYLRGQENISYTGQVILTADTNKIVFLADVNDNGVFDTIEYSVGNRSSLTQTANVADLPFYRKENGVGGMNTNFGITQFRMEFFDYTGNKLTTPVSNRGMIATLSLTVAVESPYISDANFPDYNAKAFWKQIRLAIPNLRYK